MSDKIKHVTDTTFANEVLESPIPVLVDYWAEWCGPCKMIAPVLEDIASENKGKLAIAKLNVDDNPDVARRYEVLSNPDRVLHHVEVSLFPNWENVTQERFAKLEGDRLTLSIAPDKDGAVGRVFWQRAKR